MNILHALGWGIIAAGTVTTCGSYALKDLRVFIFGLSQVALAVFLIQL